MGTDTACSHRCADVFSACRRLYGCVLARQAECAALRLLASRVPFSRPDGEYPTSLLSLTSACFAACRRLEISQDILFGIATHLSSAGSCICVEAALQYSRDDTAVLADTEGDVCTASLYACFRCWYDFLKLTESGLHSSHYLVDSHCLVEDISGFYAGSDIADEVHFKDAEDDSLLDWIAVHLHGLFRSLCALVLAALLRLLLFGLALRGGQRNVDPLIRGGRALTKGASFGLLIFAIVAQPCSAGPASGSASPDHGAAAFRRLTRLDLAHQLQRGAAQHGAWVECVGEAIPPLFEVARPEVVPDLPEEEDPWRRIAVRVFMLGKVDKYISVWVQDGFTEERALHIIAAALLLDPEQLHIFAIRPQLSGDTLDVAVVPAWWADSDFCFFCLDGSEVNRPSYLCTVSNNCDFQELRSALGPHLVAGLQVYVGNDARPLDQHTPFHISDAALLRIRYEGRAGVALPDMAEALSDTYWARDLHELALPRAANPASRILVIGHRSSFVYHGEPDIPGIELHRRLARLTREAIEDVALVLPRDDFELPAYRGMPIESLVALVPRSAYPDAQNWTGVFVDARDLGASFVFQLHSRDDLSTTDILRALCFDLLPGFEAYLSGYDSRVPAGRFRCLIGSCLGIWLDRPGLAYTSSDTDQDDARPAASARNLSEEQTDSASPRSRSPRRGVRGGEFEMQLSDEEDLDDTNPQFTLHAVVFSLQSAPCRVSTCTLPGKNASEVTTLFRASVCGDNADRCLIPLRPQPDCGELRFMASASWVHEAGLFPCLVDATWYGLPAFVKMFGASVTFSEVRDSLSIDWPDNGVVYVLGAGRLSEEAGPLFVHRGLSLVIRPFGFPPAFSNLEDKVAAFFSEGPPTPEFRDVGLLQDSFACLGPQMDDAVIRCPMGHPTELKDRISAVTGLTAEDFYVVSSSRWLHMFCCRGLQVEDFVGVQPLELQNRVGIFLDARDLGYEVQFLCVGGSSMYLKDLLTSADVARPPDKRLRVQGAVSYIASSEHLIFGQRSVLTIAVDDSGAQFPQVLSGLPFQSEGEQGDPSESDAPDDLQDADGQMTSSSSGCSGLGNSLQDPYHGRKLHNFMWMPTSRLDAFDECQLADTSDECVDLSTALMISPACLRHAFLDKVWASLTASWDILEDSIAEGERFQISLDDCLPAYTLVDEAEDGIPRFSLDSGQCALPVSDLLLRDLWRFVPFAHLSKPPARLHAPQRFACWMAQADWFRSPGPGECLVLTSDGSYSTDPEQAGWGLAVSVRPDSAQHSPGRLIGCLWGSLQPLQEFLGDALSTMGAYIAEVVGLLWAAIVVFQLRWRGNVVMRCDNISALRGASGTMTCKSHTLCNAMRALHLSLFCYGANLLYEHVHGHTGDTANELADALATFGAGNAHGHGGFGLHFRDWLASDGAALMWLPHAVWHHSHPRLGPRLHDGLMTWDADIPPLRIACADAIRPFLRAIGDPPSDDGAKKTAYVGLTMASFNALSLSCPEHHRDQGGLHHVTGRVWALRQSLEQAHVVLCGVQEARTPVGTARCGPYWRVSSGTDPQHIFGNELWVHTAIPFCQVGEDDIFFEPEHFSVLHSEPTILLIRVANVAVYWCIAIVHAPHRARPLQERTHWWERLERLCVFHGDLQDWFLLGDCNARLGSHVTCNVGSHQPDEEDDSGRLFHAFLSRMQMVAPCTFPGSMLGEGGTLVQKRNGALVRSDYVCAPLRLQASRLCCWVEPQISAGHGTLDHFATLLWLDFMCMSSSKTAARSRRIDAAAIEIRRMLPSLRALFALRLISIGVVVLMSRRRLSLSICTRDWSRSSRWPLADLKARAFLRHPMTCISNLHVLEAVYVVATLRCVLHISVVLGKYGAKRESAAVLCVFSVADGFRHYVVTSHMIRSRSRLWRWSCVSPAGQTSATTLRSWLMICRMPSIVACMLLSTNL